MFGDGIDEVAILAPFFGVYEMSPPLTDFAGALFSKLPNFYVWWDPDKKESLAGPPHAYPRFGTRCMRSRDAGRYCAPLPSDCARRVK